jgi:23S rRNA (adenine2030-N6)-methyltransferase
MLSYQHAYHAGNLADVQKHAVLAVVLDYMTRKEKPLSYLETHAGRGLYDLAGAEAAKTGEAAAGIGALASRFPPAHAYARSLAAVRAAHGPDAYPGSPAIAAALLRPGDRMTLAELHPGEVTHLRAAMAGTGAEVLHQDGLAMALSRTPPDPRRGVLLIDPSYEVKTDYVRMPEVVASVHRRWNVGVIVLWYPILTDMRHVDMRDRLAARHPEALLHEVRFPPVRDGHRMIGSGLFVLNPPFGLADAAAGIATLIEEHA